MWARGELALGSEEEQAKEANAHTDAALAFFGVTVDRGPSPESTPPLMFYLWPENQTAFATFLNLRTQWRVGLNGKTGLDDLVVRAEVERQVGRSACRAVAERRNRLMSLMRAMEDGALQGWSQRAEDARDQQR